jgi:hypothetical protein
MSGSFFRIAVAKNFRPRNRPILIVYGADCYHAVVTTSMLIDW